MTIEITSRDTFEPTIVSGSFKDIVQELELEATKNNHFALFHEVLPEGGSAPVALEMRNITRLRDLDSRPEGFLT